MLTILIGLPGSGKSTFGHEQRQKTPGLIVYEDFLGASKPLDRGKGLFSLLNDVRAGMTVIADDVFLCRLDYRTTFATLLAPFLPGSDQVQWVYYDNSPDDCRSNVERRFCHSPQSNDREKERAAKRREHSLHWIEDLSSQYHIPDGIKPVPVVRYL